MFRFVLILCGVAALAGNAFAQPASTSSAFDPLVASVIERLGIGEEVARAKWDSGKPISDPARESALLEQVRIQAAEAGIPAQWAQQFFRDQIEASKLIQTVLLERWHRTGSAPTAAPGDLSTSLRPRLDRLSATLIQGLRQSTASSQQADCSHQLERVAARQATATQLDALHRAALREALRHACSAPVQQLKRRQTARPAARLL